MAPRIYLRMLGVGHGPAIRGEAASHNGTTPGMPPFYCHRAPVAMVLTYDPSPPASPPALHGHRMGIAWALHGHCMARAWRAHGHSLPRRIREPLAGGGYLERAFVLNDCLVHLLFTSRSPGVYLPLTQGFSGESYEPGKSRNFSAAASLLDNKRYRYTLIETVLEAPQVNKQNATAQTQNACSTAQSTVYACCRCKNTTRTALNKYGAVITRKGNR